MEKFSRFSDQWAPKIVARMNDYHFKIAKVEGEFVWHNHPETDEVFLWGPHEPGRCLGGRRIGHGQGQGHGHVQEREGGVGRVLCCGAMLPLIKRSCSAALGTSLLISIGWIGPVGAQAPTRSELSELAHRSAPRAIETLRDLLSIPNDAHFADHVSRNMKRMERAFSERQFEIRRLSTDGAPLLLAQRKGSSSDRTVLVYLQIDGQPIDASKWELGHPYQPVLARRREGNGWKAVDWEDALTESDAGFKTLADPELRVFARSASDAKGPVAAFLTALSIIDEEKRPQPFDLKVIMDFEEEMGSPFLPSAVDRHRDLLAADFLLIFDGPRHVSNRPTLTFGARGIATITLTVFGPRVPQHSGHYGNYAPNPAIRLSQILASMKDRDGRVVIPGFYDGVHLDAATRDILEQTPDDESEIRRRVGIADIDAVAATYQEALQYPSLNVRGLSSGWVGEESRTIIPSTATAEIDVRLVPETNAERLIQLIREHIQGQGFFLIDGSEPSEQERMTHSRIASFSYEISYGAFQTPYDSDVGLWLNRAMNRAFGEDPVRIRMSGGSIPISPFVEKLGLPAVTVPTVNRDNNQHSPNENLRLGNYIEAITTFLAILTQPISQ